MAETDFHQLYFLCFFFISFIIFSFIWGGVADSFGKRKAVIISGISLILSTLAFGFSYNLTWATVTRFLQGCSLGK